MKKIYFIMALGLATLSGCSDFLDQNNKSNVPSAEFYQTSAGFASLTNSAYSTLRELYNAQPQLFVGNRPVCRRKVTGSSHEPIYLHCR